MFTFNKRTKKNAMKTKSVHSFFIFFFLLAISILTFAHCDENSYDKIYLNQDAILIIDNQLVVELERGKKTTAAVYTDEQGMYVLSSDLSKLVRKRSHISRRRRFHNEMHKEEKERRRRLGINENYSDVWNTWYCEWCDYLNHNDENTTHCGYCKRVRS